MPVVRSERLLNLVLAPAAALVLLAACAGAALAPDAPGSFSLLAFGGGAAALLLLVPYVQPAVLLTFGLLLSIFSGHWDLLGLPIGPDRLLLVPGIVAALAQQLLPDRNVRLRVQPVHWVLAALAVYVTGSAVFAGTLLEEEPLFALLDKLGIISFLLFVVAPLVFATRRQRDVLLTALVALGGYLGLTALFEATDLQALVVPGFINDPTVGIHTERARGPFLESVGNGMGLFTCIVACAIAYASWQAPWARRCAAGIAVLCTLGILFTLTRQVWLGSTLGTMVALLAFPELRRYVVPLIATAAVLIAGSFVVVEGLRESSADRASSSRPVWDRLNSNRAGLEMARSEPLLGAGWYRFGAESPNFYQLADNYPLTDVVRPHNVFVATAAELGLVGLVLLLVALALAIVQPILRRGPPELRPWRIGLLAIAINWFVIANFAPLGYAFGNYVLWLWAGIVAGGARIVSR